MLFLLPILALAEIERRRIFGPDSIVNIYTSVVNTNAPIPSEKEARVLDSVTIKRQRQCENIVLTIFSLRHSAISDIAIQIRHSGELVDMVSPGTFCNDGDFVSNLRISTNATAFTGGSLKCHNGTAYGNMIADTPSTSNALYNVVGKWELVVFDRGLEKESAPRGEMGSWMIEFHRCRFIEMDRLYIRWYTIVAVVAVILVLGSIIAYVWWKDYRLKETIQ